MTRKQKPLSDCQGANETMKNFRRNENYEKRRNYPSRDGTAAV